MHCTWENGDLTDLCKIITYLVLHNWKKFNCTLKETHTKKEKSHVHISQIIISVYMINSRVSLDLMNRILRKSFTCVVRTRLRDWDATFCDISLHNFHPPFDCYLRLFFGTLKKTQGPKKLRFSRKNSGFCQFSTKLRSKTGIFGSVYFIRLKKKLRYFSGNSGSWLTC